MRFVSPVALGLMLALGAASSGVSVPAAIAKEKAEAQGPKLKLSKDFIPAISKANGLIAKKDIEGGKAAMAEALPLATTNDDKYQYYAILLNLSIAANDAAMQGEALRGMLDTGLVPESQQGQFNTIVANNALSAKDYDAAISYGEKARALGYKPEQVNPILAQAVWGKGGNDPAQISRGLDLFKAGIDAMKAAGEQVPVQWYQVGVSKAAAVGQPQQLRQWADMAYAADPSGENLRTVLRVFQRDNPTMTNRENLDLLRLMNVSGGLALKPDFLEYAEMAFKGGLYGEVSSAINAGRAKGVLTANDNPDFYAIATQRMTSDKASLGAAATDAAKAANGKVASATADAYMGYGDYAKAIPLFETALQKGGVDVAEVNTRLGIAKALSGDSAGAREAFSKVSAGTRGGIAKFWLNWLNNKGAAQPAG
ncbi:MAG: hypothetical protein EP321_05630 [Sphingomonadales bacterium]|nr:MAG: hypothetical protein EP345_01320 [Sphingomonadales bacterium]TNF04869.1 MAG: hypothetical protein EP321_05630 [Sphingomonadales bacterium]